MEGRRRTACARHSPHDLGCQASSLSVMAEHSAARASVLLSICLIPVVGTKKAAAHLGGGRWSAISRRLHTRAARYIQLGGPNVTLPAEPGIRRALDRSGLAFQMLPPGPHGVAGLGRGPAPAACTTALRCSSCSTSTMHTAAVQALGELIGLDEMLLRWRTCHARPHSPCSHNRLPADQRVHCTDAGTQLVVAMAARPGWVAAISGAEEGVGFPLPAPPGNHTAAIAETPSYHVGAVARNHHVLVLRFSVSILLLRHGIVSSRAHHHAMPTVCFWLGWLSCCCVCDPC